MLAILSDEELGDKITMEQYYYNHMNKAQQAAYHSILSGVKTWCVIAICGNNPETSEIRYDYFNLDDSQIFRDHEPLIAPAPHCGDHEHFYYKEKKLSFTKKEDVYKCSLQAAKKGRGLT